MHRGWYILLNLLALCAAGAAVGAQGSGASAPTYKWTDDKGVVHYGDSVPPEYSQGARSVLNSQGVEVGRIEGTGSASQQTEQARIALLAQQRAQHDRFLLATYLSTKDIEQLRDERLGQIDGQIKASTVYIDSLATRLAALQDRAMKFKPYNSDPNARRMPDELAEELVHLNSETRSQHQALDAKRKEQADMRAQFESDIVRYRELTTRPRS